MVSIHSIVEQSTICTIDVLPCHARTHLYNTGWESFMPCPLVVSWNDAGWVDVEDVVDVVEKEDEVLCDFFKVQR